AAAAAPLQTQLGARSAELAGTSGFSSELLAHDSGALVDPAVHAALTTAIAQADEAVASAEPLVGEDIPAAGRKPGWFWELFGAAQRLDDLRGGVDDLADGLRTEAPLLDAATSAL